MSATSVPIDVRGERWRLRAAEHARTFARRFGQRSDGRRRPGRSSLVFILLALAPDFFVGPLETATTATGTALEAPCAAHMFGTDELGRDMLNLTVHGARISMTIGLLATLITILSAP